MSRLLKIVVLFCRISSLLWGAFAKETCHFKETTNRSHPIFAFRRIECALHSLQFTAMGLLQREGYFKL